MILASAILFYFAASWGTAAAIFAAGGTLSAAPTLVGLVATLVYLASRPNPRRNLTLFLALLVGSILLTIPFKDYSWDGNTYHLDAITQLSSGWNPFRQPMPDGAHWPEWLAFFTKGPWYTTASAYVLLGSLNSVKYASILLVVPSALIAYEALSDKSRQKRRLFAALWALNPVVSCQLLTKYVDGQLASIIACIAALFLMSPKRWVTEWRVAMGSLMILVINVKLNGAVYGAIIVGGMLCYWTIREWRTAQRALQVAWTVCAIGGFAGILVGWNPYVTQYLTNTIAHRDLFYPTDFVKMTHMDTNTPPDLQYKSLPEKFLRSLFSTTAQGFNGPITFQIPFMISIPALNLFAYADVRIAGFGPWFSGILLLALVALLLNGRAIPGAVIAMSVLLFLSIFTNPEAWWARYVAQFWLIPILIGFYTLPSIPVRRTAPLLQRVRAEWPQFLILAIGVNMALVLLISLASQIGFNLQGNPLPDVYAWIIRVSNFSGFAM